MITPKPAVDMGGVLACSANALGGSGIMKDVSTIYVSIDTRADRLHFLTIGY